MLVRKQNKHQLRIMTTRRAEGAAAKKTGLLDHHFQDPLGNAFWDPKHFPRWRELETERE